jgi:hypothetical protein
MKLVVVGDEPKEEERIYLKLVQWGNGDVSVISSDRPITSDDYDEDGVCSEDMVLYEARFETNGTAITIPGGHFRWKL